MRDIGDPIEGFLQEAERRLRRHLPADLLRNTLDEAWSHIEERADELVESGMEPRQARAIAVAAFSEARAWAAGIISSSYADSFTGRARVLACSAAGVLVFWPLFVLWSESIRLELGGLALDAVGIIIGSFRARQWSTKVILSIGMAAATVAFFAVGFTRVSAGGNWAATRADVRQLAQSEAREGAEWQAEASLLELGMQTYSGTIKPTPASLRANGGYVVPIENGSLVSGVPYLWSSAFKMPLRDNGRRITSAEEGRLEAQTPYRIVSTPWQAAQIWRREGPIWLPEMQRVSRQQSAIVTRLELAEKQPPGLDIDAGKDIATQSLILLFFALALDRICAGVGRVVFRRLRRKGPVAG